MHSRRRWPNRTVDTGGKMDMCARNMAMHAKTQEQYDEISGQMKAMQEQMTTMMKDKRTDKK